MTSDGAPEARCSLCGRPAAGPCARCRAAVCADCCELTDGVATFAVCLRCARRGGTSLAPAWRHLLAWLGVIVLVLALAAAAIVIARIRR